MKHLFKLREVLILSFQKRIKQNYSYRCAITGIKTKDFLVVTHIIPWHENEFIRLDPSNGICLSLFLAKAFKKGFITFLTVIELFYLKKQRKMLLYMKN